MGVGEAGGPHCVSVSECEHRYAGVGVRQFVSAGELPERWGHSGWRGRSSLLLPSPAKGGSLQQRWALPCVLQKPHSAPPSLRSLEGGPCAPATWLSLCVCVLFVGL